MPKPRSAGPARAPGARWDSLPRGFRVVSSLPVATTITLESRQHADGHLGGDLLTLVLASHRLRSNSTRSPCVFSCRRAKRGDRGRGAGTVTKKDIVRTIAEQIDLPQLRTKELVQKTFDALIEALVREGRIELRNFGVFQIKKREARMARNPRTGERVPVQAKSVVTFKPGKEMEARVRELDRRPPGPAASPAPQPSPVQPPDMDAGGQATGPT